MKSGLECLSPGNFRDPPIPDVHMTKCFVDWGLAGNPTCEAGNATLILK